MYVCATNFEFPETGTDAVDLLPQDNSLERHITSTNHYLTDVSPPG